MASGWFKESYRHTLARAGVKTTPTTTITQTKYFSSKPLSGGNGGRLLQSAYDFGSQKSSILKAGELGKSTLEPVERAGEASEPLAFKQGQEFTPDVKQKAADAEDTWMTAGGKLMEEQYMAKKSYKSYTKETAPYYDQAPNMTPDEVWAFEERTGRRHKGEPLSEYLKRPATDRETYMAKKSKKSKFDDLKWRKSVWGRLPSKTEHVGATATESGVDFVERKLQKK
jgi:hypothetical protein